MGSRGSRRRLASSSGRTGDEIRDRIDRALAACEEINQVEPRRPPGWVLHLIATLQSVNGTLAWEPADTVEAHAELLDLQVRHLRTPPAEALAEALGSLSRARAGLCQAREQLAAAEARRIAVEAARGVRCSAGYETDLEVIAEAAGASLAMLRGRSRRRALVELRRIGARYLRTRGCSLPEIGELLGRDHTTILHLLNTPTPGAGVRGRPFSVCPPRGTRPPAGLPGMAPAEGVG